jgi:hypothetical protein
LEKKFIIQASSIPRSENWSTIFSVVVNFPEQAQGYGPGPPIKEIENKVADQRDYKKQR